MATAVQVDIIWNRPCCWTMFTSGTTFAHFNVILVIWLQFNDQSIMTGYASRHFVFLTVTPSISARKLNGSTGLGEDSDKQIQNSNWLCL
jgi:hypothetical protein